MDEVKVNKLSSTEAAKQHLDMLRVPRPTPPGDATPKQASSPHVKPEPSSPAEIPAAQSDPYNQDMCPVKSLNIFCLACLLAFARSECEDLDLTADADDDESKLTDIDLQGSLAAALKEETPIPSDTVQQNVCALNMLLLLK